MIRLAKLTIFALALEVTLAQAEPITVRSGDHTLFTRLVLTVEPKTLFDLQQSGKKVVVRIENHSDGFGVSGVFDRIGRSRLFRLDSDQNTLTLQLACDCIVSSFRKGDSLIVLDIRENPKRVEKKIRQAIAEDQTSPHVGLIALQLNPDILPNAIIDEQAGRSEIAMVQTISRLHEISGSEPTNSEIVSQGFMAHATSENERRIPSISIPSTIMRREEIEALVLAGPDMFPADLRGNLESERITQTLSGIQNQLARQIGAAASRGILEPTEQRIDMPLLPQRVHVDTSIFDSSEPADDSTEDGSPETTNVRITSSSDIDLAPGLLSAVAEQGISCGEYASIEVGSWGNNIPFARHVANGRNALYGEFDKLDPLAAVSLAKSYIHFGFGAEATEILMLDPLVARGNPMLVELAEIMEFGSVRQANVLHRYLDCDSPMALWAILARSDIPGGTNPNVSAAVLALNLLPAHLRRYLAPKLSRRLTRFGHPDGAAAAMRAIERLPETLPAAGQMAKAELELSQGNNVSAQNRFTKVIESNSELSAEALIQFVDAQLRAGAPIEPDVATLVEGYATEMRDDPLGPQLQRALLIALAKSGQFDKAYQSLLKLEDRNGVHQAVRTELAQILVSNEDDIAFLSHGFGIFAGSERNLPDSVRIEFAARFADLGFPDQAVLALSQPGSITSSPKIRLLRARIALAQGRPADAMAFLDEMDGPEELRLRAAALSAAGRHDDAFESFSAVGESEEATRSAWLSENWPTLVPSGNAVLGSIVDVVNSEISVGNGRDGMLERSERALTESATARAHIEALLLLGASSGVAD